MLISSMLLEHYDMSHKKHHLHRIIKTITTTTLVVNLITNLTNQTPHRYHNESEKISNNTNKLSNLLQIISDSSSVILHESQEKKKSHVQGSLLCILEKNTSNEVYKKFEIIFDEKITQVLSMQSGHAKKTLPMTLLSNRHMPTRSKSSYSL